VSGTIGERAGRARTVRAAYVAYALASFAAAAAPAIGPFLAARALQGAANAFTTPLLLAALAEATPAEALGRAMGTYAAVQTAGVVMAPLCGGLLGALDPRLAFAVPGLVGLALAATPMPGTRRPERAQPARLRAAFTRRTAAVAGAAFLAYVAVTGLAFLVALRAADTFGLASTPRGLLLAGFGAAGVVARRPAGDLVDRVGPARVVLAGALACAVVVPLLGLAGSAGLLAALWLAAGLGSALIWAVLNTLTVQAAPANRGGAVSVVGAFKFAGNAVAPVLWLPLYDVHAWLAFGCAGAGAPGVALVARTARYGAAGRAGPVWNKA
jgi:MFS family permease